MKFAAALFFVLVALVVSTFFVYAIGAAFDHEAGCATLSGQCETP